jgi:cellulose synthase (UDP-forming)
MCAVKAMWASTVSPEVAQQIKGIGLGWLWSAYNLILLGVALLILLDVPKPDLYEWFNLRRVVKLQVGEQKFWGVTTAISEVGAEVALTQAGNFLDSNLPVTMEIVEDELILPVNLVQTGYKNEFPRVRVTFEQINLIQHRRLVEILFCRPGQWKRQDTPGEFRSLLLLFRILLKPRVIFDRKIDINAIAVSQG